MFFISDSKHHNAGGHCDISHLNCVSLDEGAFIKVPPLHPTGSISSAGMAKSEVSSEGSQGLAIVHHVPGSSITNQLNTTTNLLHIKV